MSPSTAPSYVQARSKQYLIGPAITNLSTGDLGAGNLSSGAQGTFPYAFKQKIVKSTKTVKGIGLLYRRHEQNTRCPDEAWSRSLHTPHYCRH